MVSPYQLAWKKYRRNPTAMAGLGYFLICILVAFLGYGISPDSSPHANRQLLELAKKAPGTQAHILKIPSTEAQTPHLFSQWLWGNPLQYRPMALGSLEQITVNGERLYYETSGGAMDDLSLQEFGLTSQGFDRQKFLDEYVESLRFSLGTDGFGRDLLSRILLGTRVSLSVGVLAVLLSLMIGIVLGTVAGFFGGWIDRTIMWLISVMWSLPTLLLALLISFLLGKGFWQVCLAIGISMWVEVARIVRGQIMSVRELQFTEAARALGYVDTRVMFKHVLPNVLSPIIVVAVANFGSAVLIESGLSFLGIGVEVPIPSWGSMIAEGYTYIVFSTGKWLAFFPGLALILLVVSINLIGIGLRDALDVNL